MAESVKCERYFFQNSVVAQTFQDVVDAARSNPLAEIVGFRIVMADCGQLFANIRTTRAQPPHRLSSSSPRILVVRRGTKKDSKSFLELIDSLAAYENLDPP